MEKLLRKFSSYGPIDKDLHYYVPRTELIEAAYCQLMGDVPEKGGHYVTVWAPRQCGKTWVMRETMGVFRRDEQFALGMLDFQSAKTKETDKDILGFFSRKLKQAFQKDIPEITCWEQIARFFSTDHFDRPVILIIDEFDALNEDFINKFANEFRAMYLSRQMEVDVATHQKTCMLHGLALIGVRSVLGIENIKGSPFNIQRSMRIPRLTQEEVVAMFQWHQEESGQIVESEVVERIFAETRGQPGLVSWFGELLTETFNIRPDHPIGVPEFNHVIKKAVHALPNNNILNIVSKARQAPYKETVLEMFRTERNIEFAFDDPHHNFLYLNGVIDYEEDDNALYARFSCPFVQKRLFNYFSREIFKTVDHLHDPMTDIEAVVSETEAEAVDVFALMRLYQNYLDRNRDWLLKDAPRRKTDLRIFEAVFHFNLYMYLKAFFQDKDGSVFPEFPTGNGKIDILIRRRGKLHALELKSFKDRYAHKKAIARAAEYAAQLNVKRIYLILFIESIDEDNRKQLEIEYKDEKTGTTVASIFVETGNVSAASLQ